MSPPVGTMRDEHTTDELYLSASGLGLGRNYLFGIFATLQNGKRTDVRALTYKTRESYFIIVHSCLNLFFSGYSTLLFMQFSSITS